MRSVNRLILVLAASLAACQVPRMGFLPVSGTHVGLSDVRTGMGLDTYDSVVETHNIMISGHYQGPHGKGTFRRTFEPNGNFAHHSFPENAEESVKRFDGEVLWVESKGNNSYPMTQSRSHLACSVEWILSSRWLTLEGSPFRTQKRTSQAPENAPGFALQLEGGGPQATVWLDPVRHQPRELKVVGSKGAVHMRMADWRTRRGFAWPYTIRIENEHRGATLLTTTEVLFEPSAATIQASEQKRKRMLGVSFDPDGPRTIPLRRSASGHMLVRPKLMGKDVGWFLVDTGTGVNCLDPQALKTVPEFLPNDPAKGSEISVVGLSGSIETNVQKGNEFTLGAMRAEGMDWVPLDLGDLQEVVGIQLAGVLGSDFFQRAVVEIDLLGGDLTLHDPRSYDASRLPWRPLRFDGTTPCVQGKFAPNHKGWFRLDSGSDDTVTFHSPVVRKLRMVDNATNLIPIRLKGIGGEINAVRGRIRWFELMGQRFNQPKVTMVERATGPLADPDLKGNIGVGFFTGQRLILDYPGHRVALIPR